MDPVLAIAVARTTQAVGLQLLSLHQSDPLRSSMGQIFVGMLAMHIDVANMRFALLCQKKSDLE